MPSRPVTSKAILDTDILSEIGKGIDQTVLKNAADYLAEYGQLSLTSVSIFEALFGFYAKAADKQAQRFLQLTANHEEITPTAQDYRLAAQICAALQRAGTPIGTSDPLIAACAIGRGLPLATGNTRHHGFIQNAGFSLQLVNWREPQS
jgi:predicted nucleic acid-binding protein